MIDWFRRARAEGPFLKSAGQEWSYAETITEFETRIGIGPRSIRPELSPESVFDVLAGIAGGGAVLLGPADNEPDESLAGSPLVVFTSGTSGGPKGVRLTLENLEAACKASMAHLGHDHTDTWLLAMPLSHVGGVSILIRSAFAGGSVRLLRGFDPAPFAEALHQDVTMVSIVPAMLSRLLDHDPGPYRGQRAVLVGVVPFRMGSSRLPSRPGCPCSPHMG